MSDYLHRLLSRHFGAGASVLPNANRYFSRGAEVAAEGPPAAFGAQAEAPPGDTPAEGMAAPPPPAEEASDPIFPPRPRRAQPMRHDAARTEAGQQAHGGHEARIAQRPVARTETPVSMTEAAAAPPSPGIRRRAHPAAHPREAPVSDAARQAPGTRPVPPSGQPNERHIPPATAGTQLPAMSDAKRALPDVPGKPSTSGGGNPLLPAASSHTTAIEVILPSAGKPVFTSPSAGQPVFDSIEAAAGIAVAALPGAATGGPQREPREPRPTERRDPAARATATAADAGSEAAARSVPSLPDAWTHDELVAPSAAAPGDSLATPHIRPLEPLPAARRSAAAATPEIAVTIGTIELHAAAVPPAPAAAASAAPARRGPRLSLDEYLERRDRRPS